MPAQIGIISDIHMRSNHREQVRACLQDTVELLRASDPDLIVILGDVIEDESAALDREHIELVKETLRFDCQVQFLAGNHDSEALSLEELTDLFDNDLWGTYQVEGEKLVFLNTSAPWLSGFRGEVTDEQLDMLRRELTSDTPFTLFVHHPIHYYDLGGSYWWSTHPEQAFCGNKKQITEILYPEMVKGVISGHLHENALTNYRGIENVTLNAFSKETEEKPVTGTYAEVRIDDRVTVDVKVGNELIRSYRF